MIRTIRSVGNDSAFTQLLSKRFTVVAFVESQTLGTPSAFTELDAIYRCQDLTLVVPVGFAQSEIERISVGVNHHVAFEAAHTVFPRIAYLIFAPFFDFTMLASW